MPLPYASFVLLPITRAVSQLDDPPFVQTVLQGVAWSLACFSVLYAGTVWSIHHLLGLHGWLAWSADFLGVIGASLLAFWLFLPVAAGIATLYFDQVAMAVERRYYPNLSPPASAPMTEQVWDGVAVAARVLALNVAALILAVLLPGVGLFLAWGVAAYAIGRGLFVAVAMRRMPRFAAESVYRQYRGVILVQGAILAFAAFVPILNLLIPVIGTAAMVHVLDMSIQDSWRRQN